MTIAVLGGGAFGSALANLWAMKGDEEVLLYARNRPKITSFGAEFSFDPALQISTDWEGLLRRADAVVMAVPTQAVGALMAQIASHIRDEHLIVSCAKGYSLVHHCTPAQEIAQWVPSARIYALSGPGFAADLAQQKPTAMVIAGAQERLEAVQKRLSTPSLRLYRSTDRDCVELGGALKNVLALGAGAIMGAGLGESARAAFLTRGMVELMRIAEALGYATAPLMGLCGFGDLILTAHSEQSRNLRQGLSLGRGDALDASLTTEGLATVGAFCHLAREHQLDLPLFYAIEALCDGKVTVQELTQTLMQRNLIGE